MCIAYLLFYVCRVEPKIEQLVVVVFGFHITASVEGSAIDKKQKAVLGFYKRKGGWPLDLIWPPTKTISL